MIKLNYKKDCIEFQLKSNSDSLVDFNNWLSNLEDVTFFNVINDLIVNGSASLKDNNTVTILFEDLSKLDDFEYRTLNLPDAYPYDIFIDIIGSGLKDLNLKLKYSFQDFAHGNGSGNIIFRKEQLLGAYLNGDSDYLLSFDQFRLINEIEEINNTSFINSNEVLKSIAKLQEFSINANAVLSKILVDTDIVLPEKLKIDIEKIGENKYRLKPVLEHADNDKFERGFKIFPRVKQEYSYKTLLFVL